MNHSKVNRNAFHPNIEFPYELRIPSGKNKTEHGTPRPAYQGNRKVTVLFQYCV